MPSSRQDLTGWVFKCWTVVGPAGRQGRRGYGSASAPRGTPR